MQNIIEVAGLKKSYGNLEAVRGIDFTVQRGSLFAFLGPNGAGKSTTIDMVSTQLRPDAGQIRIDGLEIGRQDDEIRQRIGIVFQDSVLDALLTVKENLMVRSSFYDMDKAAQKQAVQAAAKTADVLDFINQPYGKLSGGQRRRADIARALVNTPKLLFLDEPTTGLDPQTRKNVWETIRSLQLQQGMTIFLTTHYMEEAAQADAITIIDHGKVLAAGTPVELKEKYTSDMLKIMPKQAEPIQNYLEQNGLAYTRKGEEIDVLVHHTVDTLPILEAVRQHIASFEVIRGSMDDVFINITGEEIRN